MGAFEWSNERSIYLAEIDAEHRSLYCAAAELQDALEAELQAPQLKPILLNMVETTEEHFRHEERLMRAVHYSAFQWHKGQHDTVRKKLKQAIKAAESGDLDACKELLRFFNTWLRDHLGIADQMMGSFIRNYLRVNTSVAS